MGFKNSVAKLLGIQNSEGLVKRLRSKGIQIGNNVHFFGRIKDVSIDITRPSLVTIGDNVMIVSPFTITTHGYESFVFKNKFNEFLGSSGKVTIGDNVYFGKGVSITKNVNIGNNVIVGTNSVVTRSLPDDGVYAGVPCKKISNLEDYFIKRKKEQLSEAKEYAISIKRRYNRLPVPEDFIEFFPLFLGRNDEEIKAFNLSLSRKLKRDKRAPFTVLEQMGPAYDNFLKSEPNFKSFEDFLDYCELYKK